MAEQPLVTTTDLGHVYDIRVPEPIQALEAVDLSFEPGEHVALLGANGSGKSTLARHFNALLLPTTGRVVVDGVDTLRVPESRELKRRVRSAVGLVFQNPDSQIVSTIVEDDVAFGPENLGLPRAELRRRVDEALEAVGMTDQAERPPHLLSAGQRQRVAIAGALAMEPRLLVFDEATAMLDPLGRADVLEVMERLHREGMAVLQVTHHMNEAALAGRVVVLRDGRVEADGPPEEVLTDPGRLEGWQLDVPPTVAIARAVAEKVDGFPTRLLTVEAVVAAVRERRPANGEVPAPPPPASEAVADPVVEVEGLGHTYLENTPLEHRALRDASLAIGRGEVVAVLGHTGSGKSTLVQHLNGLYRPQEGRVVVAGEDLSDRGVDVRALRRRVGLVFQRPEDQLFERFVGDDVAFGPLQYGVEGEELRETVRRAMGLVGLPFERFKDRPLFALSGGERRRVALAGVLALRPEILVLDEPTAGLDPATRDEVLEILRRLRDQEGITVVLVSHNMGEVAEVADRAYVMAGGTVVASGAPRELFARPERLRELGLDLPPAAEVVHRLRALGYPLPADGVTETEVAAGIAGLLGGREPAAPARQRREG